MLGNNIAAQNGSRSNCKVAKFNRFLTLASNYRRRLSGMSVKAEMHRSFSTMKGRSFTKTLMKDDKTYHNG